MFSDASEEAVDLQILEGFSWDDLDKESFRKYRNRFASHKPNHPWLSESDEVLLHRIKGWRMDRKTGKDGLTLAGLLMFGTAESIQDALPNYHVDYREHLTESPQERWSDRLTLDGTWSGNLFQFYLKASQRLFADLKVPFSLDADLFRKGEPPDPCSPLSGPGCASSFQKLLKCGKERTPNRPITPHPKLSQKLRGQFQCQPHRSAQANRQPGDGLITLPAQLRGNGGSYAAIVKLRSPNPEKEVGVWKTKLAGKAFRNRHECS